MRVRFGGFSWFVTLLALLFATASAQAQAPTLTVINPPTPPAGQSVVVVTLTGTGFNANSTLVFTPPTITATNVNFTSATAGTATFKVSGSASGLVTVQVVTGGQASNSFSWDTGVVANQCLEALQSTGCMLRWEVDASGVTGSSSQTSNTTTPNILFKLDYQFLSPDEPQALRLAKQLPETTPTEKAAKSSAMAAAQTAKQSPMDRLAGHVVFKTGYTQVPFATTVQPISTPGNTTAPTSCPGTTSSTTSMPAANCTAATPQQAFIADAALRLGWTFGRNGQSAIFTEFGFGARGSFEDIVPANQVIQSGGLSYVDLSSANLENSVGLYEGTLHFRLGEIGHNTPAGTNGKYHNVSDLLVLEAGYQNNSGLQHLIASNPQAATRNRFVGRFYAYPELPGPTHTKILVGMEYSGGIDGGPKVIQLFWGTNLNPAKLINPTQ